jgi:hypothetical protein
MTPYERLIHQLQALQTSIRIDWRDLEASDLTTEELDRVRERIRGTKEAMAELGARLDKRFGPKADK